MRGKERGFRLIAVFLAFVMLVEMAGVHLGTLVFATEAENATSIVSDNTTEVSVETDMEAETQVEGNLPQEQQEPDVQVQEEISVETEEPVAEQAEIEKATIELSCTDFSSWGGVKLAWTAEDVSGLSLFHVYKDGAYIGARKISSSATYSFTDYNVVQNGSYTYQVFGIDSEGAQVQRSETLLVDVVDDWYVSSHTTLTEDKVVKNLTINGTGLALNGHKLTVLGDVTLNGSSSSYTAYLTVGDGILECSNFYEKGYSYTDMTGLNGYVHVKGDYISTSTYSYSPTFTGGCLEIEGNFSNVESVKSFYANGTHRVVLSGEEKQTISFNENNHRFGILEIKNTSEEGFYFEGPVYATEFITNGCNVDINVRNGVTGWTLNEDEIINGDLILVGDTLDLNGHKLTVNGNLLHASGNINVNGGTLDVKGDYTIQYQTNTAGEDIVMGSGGLLKMINANDHVIVGGTFLMSSLHDHSQYLTNGVLEVKGDVIQTLGNGVSNVCFRTTNNFKLLLSGNGLQTVTCSEIRIANLEITNSSKDGVIFGSEEEPTNYNNNRIVVTGLLNDNGNKSKGYVCLYETSSLANNTFNGNVWIRDYLNYNYEGKTSPWIIEGNLYQNGGYYYRGDVTVKGNYYLSSGAYLKGNTLKVEGDSTLNGYFDYMEGGTFWCDGDVTTTSGFDMEHPDDYVYIGGDYTSSEYSNYYDCFTGTMEVKGDFIHTAGTYQPEKDHTVILSGTEKQTVQFASESSAFNKLILLNSSADGIYAEGGLRAANITWNNCKVTGGSDGTYGYKLTKDTTLQGDFCLSAGEMDLNGYELTITGNLIHAGGTLNINGGKLVVKKDYRLQTETKAEDDSVTYSAGNGNLVMINENDRVVVYGDFVMGSRTASEGNLTAGILEVKGNVEQITYINAKNFVTTDDFKLLLSGTSKQLITFANSVEDGSRIANLEIKNTSEEGVVFGENKVVVTGLLNDNGNKTSGYVIVTETTHFPNNTFGGSVWIRKSNNSYDEIKMSPWIIGGDLYQTETYYFEDNVIVKGDYTITGGNAYLQGNSMSVSGNTIIGLNGEANVRLSGGRFVCQGDVDAAQYVTAYSDSGFVMQYDSDYVYVGGDFSVTGQTGYKNGVLEIKGDFTQKGYYFYASDKHTTILSGDSMQTVSYESGSSTFNNLILQNYSEEGIYAPNGLKAVNIIWNGCNVTDDTSVDKGYKLTEDKEIDGDFYLSTGEMDLNGYTLTVSGNFIQSGGTMNLNGGKLIVKEDYRLQTETEAEDGTKSYGASKGDLRMNDKSDYVLVSGDFVVQTTAGDASDMTAGVLEVKGNVTGTSGLMATGDHKLLLSGDDSQTVYLATTNTSGMRFANIEITNASEEGVTFGEDSATHSSAKKVLVSGHLNDNGHATKGWVIPTSTTSFEKNTFHGNMYISTSVTLKDPWIVEGDVVQIVYLYLENDFTIRGNYTLFRYYTELRGHTMVVEGNTTLGGDDYSAYIKIQEGSFKCYRDVNILPTDNTGNYYYYYYANYFEMKYENDYVYIGGNFNVRSSAGANTYLAGTLEIKGDFTQTVTYSNNFIAQGTHRVLLSGDTKQTVTFSTPDCRCNILELQNTSEDGVVFNNGNIPAITFIPNNTKVTINGKGVVGWTLQEDTVIQDDLYLVGGELNLNGYNLEIAGNLYVGSGNVFINGGTLNVKGDLRYQSLKFNTYGSITGYTSSYGTLTMTNSADYVKVEGNFAIQSSALQTSSLYAGTLELLGNISDSATYYKTEGTHLTLLSGTNAQTIAGTPTVANLKVTNASETGVTGSIKVTNSLEDINQKLVATVTVSSLDLFAGNGFAGSVTLTEECILDRDFYINGTLTTTKNFDVSGNTISVGSYYLNNGISKINGGQLLVNKNMYIQNEGALEMTNPKDYVCVSDSFSIYSTADHSELLTDGVLEIRGAFSQQNRYSDKNDFTPSGNHTTILSGKKGTGNSKYIQSVRFSQPNANKFNHLILKRSLDKYAFSHSLDQICNDYILDVTDDEAPSKVKGVKVTSSTSTKVTLKWNASTDNEEVAGYDIYRGTTKVGTTSLTTFVDKGLSPNNTYIYKIYAFDEMRNISEASDAVSAVTPADSVAPTVPAALKVKTKTGTAVTIAWNASYDDMGVTGYKVFKDGVQVAVLGNVTSYRDEDVVLDQLYSYQVQAFDAQGNISELCEPIKGSIEMPKILSYTPVVNATVGGEKAQLYVYYKDVGNAVGNKVKFEYQREDENGDKVWEQIGGLLYGQQKMDTERLYSTCTWNLAGVKNGECKMRVTLYDADENTDMREFSYYVDTEGPEATDEIKISSTNGVVNMSWSKSDSADCVAYKVYRSNTEDGTYSLLYTTEANSYQDRAVVCGNTYYYKISGVDNFEQEGPQSDAASIEVTIDEERPQVTSISVDGRRINKEAQIAVRAEDNVAVATVSLEYQNPTTEKWIKVSADEDAPAGLAMFAFDTTKLADGNYKLRAIATDTSGNASVGVVEVGGQEIALEPFYATTTIDNTGVEKIVVNEVTAYPTYVTLKWDKVSDEDFGRFAVEQLQGSEYVEVQNAKTTLGAHVQGLQPEKEYTFRVVGYDDLGNRGEPSDKIVISTIADNQAPTVMSFYPAEKYFTNKIPLTLAVEDNVAVEALKLEYSSDYIKWTELTTIQAFTEAKRYVFNYTFDVSNVPEGKVYIRAYAYDTVGNVSSIQGVPIENSFVIDRTAPAKVTGMKAEGMNGYNAIRWNKPTETDIAGFRIYRAEELVGNYTLLAETELTTSYYDTTAKRDVAYSYKVQAVDYAGNVSAFSAEMVAQCREDDEAPVIHTVLPKHMEKVGGEVEIKAAVTDNVAVKEVSFEYKAVDSKEDIWTEIGIVTEFEDYPSVKWNIKKLENKNYQVRIIATDINNNISDAYLVTYTVDTAAPFAPILTGEPIGFGAKLSWNQNEEDDFSHYEIYRKLGSDTEYTLVAEVKDSVYEDYKLESGRKYMYKLRVYDDAGNYAESNMCEVVPSDEDKEAPVAVTSETYSVRVGSEVMLDASASYDNVAIAEYKWDMGNGDVVYGAKAKYCYKEVGTYYAELTVTDTSGNTDSMVMTIYVRSRLSAKVLFKVVNQKDGLDYSLNNAYLYIESEYGESNYYMTDEFGEAEVVLPAGNYTVDAYRQGFLPKSYDLTVANGAEIKKVLALTEGELVTGELTATQLTLEELEELGVDLQDPNNWYTYTYTMTYKEPGSPEVKKQSVNLKPGETVCVSGGGSSGGSSSSGQGDCYVGLTDVEGKKIVTIYEVISTLKQMYDVRLQVTNHAEQGFGFDIVNSTAKLNLPTGISLLRTSTPQNIINSLDTLAAQETKDTHWYIKADGPGTYPLSVDFNGTLLPFNAPVNTTISAKNPINVTPYINNTFTDDGFIYGDSKTYIIQVQNKEKRRIQGAIVTLEVGGKKCQTITNSRGSAYLEVGVDDQRTFNLTIEHEDYLVHQDSAYKLMFGNTDRVYLYREGESKEGEDYEEMVSSPYEDGYDIPIHSVVLDGKRIHDRWRPAYLNRAADVTHGLDIVFSEKIEKYELFIDGDVVNTYTGTVTQAQLNDPTSPLRTKLAEGEVDSFKIHIDFSVYQLLREGNLRLVAYKGDIQEEYQLYAEVDYLLFDSVIMNYNNETVDLMQGGYSIYSYYGASPLTITCNVLEETKSTVASYELLQSGDPIAVSQSGVFNVHVSDFTADETIYIKAIDKNDDVVGTQQIYLNIWDDLVFKSDGDMYVKFYTEGKVIDGEKYRVPVKTWQKLGADEVDIEFDLSEIEIPLQIKHSNPVGNKEIFEITASAKTPDALPITITMSLNGEFECEREVLEFQRTLTGADVSIEAGVEGEYAVSGVLAGIPVMLHVGLGGSGEVEVPKAEITPELKLKLLEDPRLILAVEGEVYPAIGATLEGVGLDAMEASIGIYGQLSQEWHHVFKPEHIFEKTVTTSNIGLRLKLLVFTMEVPFYENGKETYNPKVQIDQPMEAAEKVFREKLDGESDQLDFTLISRGDTSQRTPWLGGSLSEATNTIQLLQGSAYKGEAPQLVTVGDTTLLVYNTENLEQSVANGSKLAYSIYENGVFSEPTYISASNAGQYGFDVYEAGDEAYVIWQESKTELSDNVTLQEMADSIELKAAKFSEETQSFTMLGTLTDNSVYESNPQICAADGQVYATWTENSDGDIFGINGTNSVKKATFNGNSWATESIATGLGQMGSMDAGMISGAPYVAYAAGGSTSVTGLAGGQSMSVGAAQNLQFGYVGGEEALVWYADNAVKYTKDGAATATLFADESLAAQGYEYVSDASGNSSIIYSTNREGKAQVYMADYDAKNNVWGNIQAITNQDDYLEDAAGVYADGQLVLVFNQTEATVTEDSIETSTDLCCMKVGKNVAISIEDITYDQAQVMPGGDVNLNVNIANTGLATADDITISVTNEAGKEVVNTKAEKIIRAGGSEVENVLLKLPYTLAAGEYTVKATCGNSSDEKTLVLGLADLAVSAKTYVEHGNYEVEATVENLGIDPAGGKIVFINNENGSVLSEVPFDALDYSETVSESYLIGDDLYDGSKALSITAKVVTDAEQVTTENDEGHVYIPKCIDRESCRVVFDYANSAYAKVKKYVAKGETVEFPADPNVKGYKFLGWYKGKNQVTKTTPITGDMTLTAKYEKLPVITTPTTPPKPAVPKKNTKASIGGITYKVTKSASKNGTVEVYKVTSKKSKVTIPKTVKIKGYTFKVTSIGKNAFKNNKKAKTVVIGNNVKTIGNNAFYGAKKLTTVTIGSGVTSIGSKAFYNCKKLKTIKINSTKLKKVGKNALKGIHKKAVIKVPKKKLKAYKKLFRKKGQKSTVKMKKK